MYNCVIDSVAGYYDILWADLNIEKINNELQDFQNKYSRDLDPNPDPAVSLHCSLSLAVYRIRKLPKALKEWPAFRDLKKTIDDFSESCPLLYMMANKVSHASLEVGGSSLLVLNERLRPAGHAASTLDSSQ